jgi:hypothetical protein
MGISRISEYSKLYTFHLVPSPEDSITLRQCNTLIVILVGNQLDAQFFMIRLFESSTCFEQLCAHPQEDNCMNTIFSIITLC